MTTLAALADRVAAGGMLTREDAAVVLGSHDLITIGMMGDAVRRQMHGAQTTFGRVFEVHVEAVPAALPPDVQAGELRIVGRPASADAAYSAVRAARRIAGPLPLSGFSLVDLLALQSDAAEVYARLRSEGLDAVAEVPLDLLADAGAAVAAPRAAGLLTPRLVVEQSSSEPLPLLERAVRAQDACGAFCAVAPLPRVVSPLAPSTGYDDVKTVALARLVVRNIRSIQVDWTLYGPKLAQVALTVGADDVDGVAAVEAGALGHRRSALEEIRRNIRAAGLAPVERDGRYETVVTAGDASAAATRASR